MKGRITWRSRPGPEGGWGMSLPEIRRKYGAAVGEIVERCATLTRERRTWPTGQDVKRTLREIVKRPEVADLCRLDGFTAARIADHALRRHRIQNIRKLTPEQLRDTAAAALQSFGWRNGRMTTDDLAVEMVRELLRIGAALDRTAQDKVLADALIACGLAAGTRTVERLRKLAKGSPFFR
jgi:hypothetical protein